MDIIKKITNIVDKSSIITGDDLKSRFYHIWKTDISLESICVVLPRNTRQVSEVMKICYENDQEVVIHGGLTNLVGATKSNNSQIVISLEKMNDIIEIDTDSKTITCESGVILEDLINTCKEKDLLLPLNFGARGSAQIGGAVSTNAGGLRVFKYGMTRHLVLGAEAVLPDGTVISSLKKLIKDNSGYDLKQIFIGEFMILMGSFATYKVLSGIGAFGVVLAAIYMLWAYQRMFTGEISIQENKELVDLNSKEMISVVPLLVLMLFIGIYPSFIESYVTQDALLISQIIDIFSRGFFSYPRIVQGLRARSPSQVKMRVIF